MKKIFLAFVSFALLLVTVQAQLPDYFFPSGADAGDTSALDGFETDVGAAVDFGQVNFYGKEQTGMIVICFRGAVGWGLSCANPNVNIDTISGPSISVWLANTETNSTANSEQNGAENVVSWRMDSSEATRDLVEATLFEATGFIYIVEKVLIVTYPAQSDLAGNLNVIQQAVIVTNEGRTFSLFNYGDLTWCDTTPGTPADIGFTNAATPRDQVTLAGSANYACEQFNLTSTRTHENLEYGQHLYEVTNIPVVAAENPNRPLALSECTFMGYTMPEIDRALLCYVNSDCLEPLLEATMNRLVLLGDMISESNHLAFADGVLGEIIENVREFCGGPRCDLDRFARQQRKFVQAINTLEEKRRICDCDDMDMDGVCDTTS